MLKGIDVFEGQGHVDWGSVKAAGNAFAFIRAAYGTRADTQAANNLQRARAAGLLCGVYHFVRATSDPVAQVGLMKRLIDDLAVGPGDLPPVIDVEDNPKFDGPWDPKKNDAFLTLVDRWIDAVRQKTKANPIIYTRASFWVQLGNPSAHEECPLWVADYGAAALPRLPKQWDRFAFWQYSDRGKADGVHGNVDVNRFHSDDPGTLRALLLQ